MSASIHHCEATLSSLQLIGILNSNTLKLCEYPHVTIYPFLCLYVLFLFYWVCYNFLLPLFIMMLKLSTVWWIEAPPSGFCVLVTCLPQCLAFSWFLAQDALSSTGSSCAFSAQVLEPAISLRSLRPYRWKIVFINQTLGTRCARG